MRLRPISLAVALLLLLVLAYTGWWVAASAQLRRAVSDVMAAQQAQGNSVTPAEPAIGGFPLRLSLRLDQARWQRSDGMLVEAGSLEAWARPWDPLRVTLHLDNGARVVGPPPGGAESALALTAPAGDGELLLNRQGGIQQWKIRLDQPRLESGGLLGPLTASGLELSWTVPELPAATANAVTGTFNLLARAITLPGPVPPPLDTEMQEIALEAQLHGILPPHPDPAALRGWSEAGGTVEVTGFRLLWSGMDLRGNATLALDGMLQPQMAGSAELSGADALADMMVARGTLNRDQGKAMKTALGFLSQQQPDGRRAVRVPVTIQNRAFSIGPIRIGDLPPIEWE